jgi:large subunit ribosomal protein L21
MYAIVDIAGQQYKLEKNQKVIVNRLDGKEGSKVDFDQVLLVDNDGKVQVGTPLVKNTVVTASIVAHFKGDKVKVFKKKRRKGYQTLNGHRQALTELLIESIGEGKAKPAAEKKAEPKAKKEEKPVQPEKKADAPAAKKTPEKKDSAATKKSAVKPKTASKPKTTAKTSTAKKDDSAKQTKASTTGTKKATAPKKAEPKAKKADDKKTEE